MGIVLALAAALLYGAADFFGGLSTKRNLVWAVVGVSGAAGLVTALLALPLLGRAVSLSRDLELGALVGLVGLLGIAALYRGLAIARMSVVAPITAVIAAGIPVLYGVLAGERPSIAAGAGILLALLAVMLVSRTSDEDVAGDPEPHRAGLVLACLSGVGFGLVYLLLALTSRSAWPLVASRSVFVVFVGIIILIGRMRVRFAPGTLRLTLLSGFVDMSANVLYLVALRHTIIAIAAVIASLYPASTVLLARIVLHERLHRVQWLGVACAFAGVVLMARG